MRFILAFLTTVVLLLGAAAAINYFVNPYAVYPTRSLAPVSSNDLERALRELEDPAAQPELVVFGSSRSFRLRAIDLECYSGLQSANQAYTGATPEGYFALASYLVENKPAPKMFIVGVDVEAFQPDAKRGDKIQSIPRLQRYLNGTSRLENLWLDTTNLVSFAQLNDAARTAARSMGIDANPIAPLERAWQTWVNPLTPAKTANAAPTEQLEPKSQRPAKTVENRAELAPELVMEHYQNRFRGYTTLSTEEQDYFEVLVRLARDKRIPTKVFITTLHPQLIEVLNKQGFYPKRYADVRAWLQELAQEYAFEFYDFSTPDKFGGSATDFFNLSHIDEINGARLIGAMFTENGRAAQCAPQTSHP